MKVKTLAKREYLGRSVKSQRRLGHCQIPRKVTEKIIGMHCTHYDIVMFALRWPITEKEQKVEIYMKNIRVTSDWNVRVELPYPDDTCVTNAWPLL